MKKDNLQPQNIDAEEAVQEEVSPDTTETSDTAETTDSAEKPDTVEMDSTETPDNESEHHTLKEVLHEQAREDEEPMSTSFTLRKILGGDILSAEMIRSQIWLIIIMVLFVIVYISNRYSVQKNLLEIDKLNKELQDVKYKALSSSSQLTEKSRESHVLELLKQNNDSTLKMPEQPPYIIEVPR